MDRDFYYARLTEKAPTAAYFDELRSDEKERIHLKNYHFTYFNVDDIHQANRYFQALKKEDANKLMQRLRKIKFQKSRRYAERKVGIDVDETAYQKIKSFSDEYGFKTLSIGIIVMAEMASPYCEKDVTVALESLYRREMLKPGDVFISNANTHRIEEWLNDGLIFFSKERYKYYLSSGSITDGCYEIDYNESNIIRQMRSSNRVFLGESTLKSQIIGLFSKGAVKEEFTNEEIDLTHVRSVQAILGNSDTFKAFRAIETLFLKWDLDNKQKFALLGFDPKSMKIDDLDEVKLRISLVLNIHEQLRHMFDNPENLYGYMSLVNHNKHYNGKRPIDIACESLDGLKLVCNSFSSFCSQAG